MLSALIGTEHSYPTLLLAKQLVDQRFVHPGPLVLGTTLLKLQRPHQIRTNLSRAIERKSIGLYLIPIFYRDPTFYGNLAISAEAEVSTGSL